MITKAQEFLLTKLNRFDESYHSMCGRYTLTANADDLETRFSAKIDRTAFNQRFNIAPSQSMPVLCQGENEFRVMKWGLVPSWAKSEKDAGWINARSETLTQKPAFRKAASKGRCIVPATGFYEWKMVDGKKIPFYITSSNSSIFAMAGIFEEWKKIEPPLFSFAILTREANDFMKPIHDRMPVILNQAQMKAWLSNETTAPVVSEITESLRAYPVSTKVNNPRIDDETLVTEIKL